MFSVIRFLLMSILGLLLIATFVIVDIGFLWVLRVAIDWWLDVDYVEKAKEWIYGKGKENHR